MVNKKKIGIFGSAFDPPTLGHMDAIFQALQTLDEVILVASANHAFGKRMAPWHHRIAMLKLLHKELSAKLVRQNKKKSILISEVELQLLKVDPKRPVYTFDVMTALQSENQNATLYFLRGPDNAEPSCWQKFYRHQDIEAQWQLLTLKLRAKVRSTIVRQLLSRRLMLGDLKCRTALNKFVIPKVADYLFDNVIY